MTKPTLISFNLCPFVQRSVITLNEKGIDFDIEYIDLNAKPDWFLAISPFGKVPVLKVDDTVLFESAVISEYLDETNPPSMHPSDPLEKAFHRAWIEFSSAGIMDGYRLMVAETEEDARKAIDSAKEKFARLEPQLGDGPYFAGDSFSLVDAASAPMIQRLEWCEQIHSFGLFAEFPKMAAWRDALLSRQSVKDSLLPNIDDIFRDYLKGIRSESMTTDPSWLGAQL